MQTLAEKLRPTCLNEVVGQTHLVGKNKVISNLIENIKTTMAAEHQFLTQKDVELLTKCYNKEIMPDEALRNIKSDIIFRVVK